MTWMVEFWKQLAVDQFSKLKKVIQIQTILGIEWFQGFIYQFYSRMTSLVQLSLADDYRISSYCFRGNYSSLNLSLCTVTFGDSTYRCGDYSRAETIRGNMVPKKHSSWSCIKIIFAAWKKITVFQQIVSNFIVPFCSFRNNY